MGYIRLVRSGGLYYVANAIKFVPDIDDIPKYEELVSKENLSPEAVTAAKYDVCVMTYLCVCDHVCVGVCWLCVMTCV